MLTVKDLCVNYGEKRILNDINLHIDSGEILAVVGSNGAGKTTLFKAIMRFINPVSGGVYIDKRDIASYSRKSLSRHIAYVPQCHNCTFPYTVREMVVMGRQPRLGTFSEPTGKDENKADEALKTLGIDHLGARKYRKLSGGEKQLVLIARALAAQPRILVMDEPTASLDFHNSLKVLSEILRLKAHDMALLVTCHSPRQARVFADSVLMLKQGAVHRYGDAALLTDPAVLHELYNVNIDEYSDEKIREYIFKTA